jgi:hypothetical protein
MFPLALYSPLNFYVGLRAWLEARSAMSAPQAIQEMQDLKPRWQHRLLASVLTGLFVLYLLRVLVPGSMGPAARYAGSHWSASQLVAVLGSLVSLVFVWWLGRHVLRAARFYAAMCRLGASVRAGL